MATYLGAKAVIIKGGIIRIVQGNLVLEARLLEKDRMQKDGRSLQAPVLGDMVRTIHEYAACKAFYRLRKGKKTLFAFKTKGASFEYEYPA